MVVVVVVVVVVVSLRFGGRVCGKGALSRNGYACHETVPSICCSTLSSRCSRACCLIWHLLVRMCEVIAVVVMMVVVGMRGCWLRGLTIGILHRVVLEAVLRHDVLSCILVHLLSKLTLPASSAWVQHIHAKTRKQK